MSICPPRPDTNRRCFAPCRIGTFCKCKGRVIAKNDDSALSELLADLNRKAVSSYDEEMADYRRIEREGSDDAE